ncbi:hypothetical protein BAUCODRAFT_30467 [Baudoinia panamericana UAMH 10762]|uniref:Calponin-homology (CH) domain-containing protein n=1 Tax=Baudoinia panamericana (strain UAMH 10762) TaxID=717646 RepID=M2N7F8_BAUPA|nr:uncharacterized protein BAUCODRAFT_30467 [Baudoinia panamericana UAMH 10762]EMD00024.1 hypothetical protein BAUCODRAFT_30467 [Baudoinia panamericana UAMH 10762]
MLEPSFPTPCPAPGPRITQRRSFVATTDDDTCTTEIEYTRAVQNDHISAPPKRPRIAGKRAGQLANIRIFEDVIECQELQLNGQAQSARNVLLARPAQRLPAHAVHGVGKHEAEDEDKEAKERPCHVTGHSRPRPSPLFGTQRGNNCPRGREGRGQESPPRDARRRTIFVPSDDTTIHTIHPGADTTARLNDTFHVPSYATCMPRPDERQPVAEANVLKTSRQSLAVAPKKRPLQQISITQNRPAIHIAGKNGGKENAPPDARLAVVLTEKKVMKVPTVEIESLKTANARTKLHEATAASQARQAFTVRKSVSVLHKNSAHQQPNTCRAPASGPGSLTIRPESPVVVAQKPNRPVRVFSQRLTGKRASSKAGPKPRNRVMEENFPPRHLLQYPVLSENVSEHQLYDDGWLSHEEIAMTELLNEIFTRGDANATAGSGIAASLRERMLDIYQQPTVTALHSRLRASLLCGALSRPKDMPSTPDLVQDIGLRKRFLHFWLHSYNEDALQAAAEVVVGRQSTLQACEVEGSLEAIEGVIDKSKKRRALVRFLETFFVTIQDIAPDTNHNSPGNLGDRCWRRTIQRSLLMIWLLDRAKAAGIVCGRLFKRNSPYKSSAAVVHALSGLLIPSIGDITRPLRHLEYFVDHEQDPLDDVDYRIRNLAVDLRDGILLTRLVELLLFKQDQTSQGVQMDQPEDKVTITLADASVLGTTFSAHDDSCPTRSLSQHLKMPCPGRAQKAYNVDVALSALATRNGRGAAAGVDVSADDIVDGHRERTLNFLWAIVSEYGLRQLVDWEQLAAHTRRLHQDDTGPAHGYGSVDERKKLLELWAARCKQS